MSDYGEHVFFDWYQATIHDVEVESVLSMLNYRLDIVDMTVGKPVNGYQHCREFVRGTEQVCRVMWGGNPGVHVLATGDRSPEVADVLRGDFPNHYCSRVDARVDWVLSGLFDNCAAALLRFAKSNGIRIDQRGDWHSGEARTLYLHSSSGSLVIYEKGYQMGGDPSWVRLECRSKPDKKPARANLATLSPKQVLSFADWAKRALSAMGYDAVAYQSVSRARRREDVQRSREALVRQFGGVMDLWAAELGGFEYLGQAVADEIERQRAERETIANASQCPESVPADVWARAQRQLARLSAQRG